MVALLIHFKICILGKIAEPPLPPLPGNAPPPHRKYALPLITAIIQKSFAPPYIQGGEDTTLLTDTTDTDRLIGSNCKRLLQLQFMYTLFQKTFTKFSVLTQIDKIELRNFCS